MIHFVHDTLQAFVVLNEFQKAREDLAKVNIDGIIDVSFRGFPVPIVREVCPFQIW